jgi:hypothetical protein
MQNPMQRGFTKGSSPMHAALPVEEAYRILTDEKQNGHLVLLDAKTAFDKVKGRGTLVRSSFYLFLFFYFFFLYSIVTFLGWTRLHAT